MNIFQIAVPLFLLMDAIGNVPIFLSVLKEIDPRRQRIIIFRELMIALGIIIAFYFIGDYLLTFLKISHHAVLLSGGVILFVIGIKLVFPKHEEHVESVEGKEPFLVPLAVPLVSGPAVLAGVMLLSRQAISDWVCIAGIVCAWLATTVILILAPQLKKFLGERGLLACEKFTGLILIMLAIQMLLNGLNPLFNS